MKRILGLLLACLLGMALLGCYAAPAEEGTGAPTEESASAVASEDASSVSSSGEASSEASAASGGGWPVQVTDLQGTEVTVSGAQRIVSLTPSSTEILIAEGVEDQIVGEDAYSPKVEGAAVCGDYNGPDVEKVASLEPDLVISGNSIQEDQIQKMRDLGLTVVSAEATTWDQIPESFNLIGQCVGERDAAQALVDQLSETVSQVEAEKPAESPTVYYVMSFGDAGNWTSGPGSFINTMIDLAGGTCVTRDAASAWLECPVEDLVAANPDIIIYSSGAGSYEDLVAAPGYSGLDAVKDGRVYEINADTVSRPGPNVNEALLSISSILNTAAQAEAAPSADAA